MLYNWGYTREEVSEWFHIANWKNERKTFKKVHRMIIPVPSINHVIINYGIVSSKLFQETQIDIHSKLDISGYLYFYHILEFIHRCCLLLPRHALTFLNIMYMKKMKRYITQDGYLFLLFIFEVFPYLRNMSIVFFSIEIE